MEPNPSNIPINAKKNQFIRKNICTSILKCLGFARSQTLNYDAALL